MNGRFHYTACGLAITSDVRMPGLCSARPAKPADLSIEIARGSDRGMPGEARVRYVSRERHEDGTPQLTVWTGSGGHRFLYRDGTEFLINEHATRVVVRWVDPLTLEDAVVYLLGPVLGFVMRLRVAVRLPGRNLRNLDPGTDHDRGRTRTGVPRRPSSGQRHPLSRPPRP